MALLEADGHRHGKRRSSLWKPSCAGCPARGVHRWVLLCPCLDPSGLSDSPQTGFARWCRALPGQLGMLILLSNHRNWSSPFTSLVGLDLEDKNKWWECGSERQRCFFGPWLCSSKKSSKSQRHPSLGLMLSEQQCWAAVPVAARSSRWCGLQSQHSRLLHRHADLWDLPWNSLSCCCLHLEGCWV